MGGERTNAMDRPTPERSIWSKLGWFVLLWAGSVLALGTVAYGIKLLIK